MKSVRQIITVTQSSRTCYILCYSCNIRVLILLIFRNLEVIRCCVDSVGTMIILWECHIIKFLCRYIYVYVCIMYMCVLEN